MRWIQKQPAQPDCIEQFVATQLDARQREGGDWGPFPINYGNFTRGAELLQLLIDEQFGLCAYTGAAIDAARLPRRRPRNLVPPRDGYYYKAHVEHLKPQSQCRDEFVAPQRIVGRDRGDDIDYYNVVAALEVLGTEQEHFGAVVRRNEPVPVWPTRQECEDAFAFFPDGGIRGRTAQGRDTVRLLRLDHSTLQGWRSGEIEAWFGLPAADKWNEGIAPTPEDLSIERLQEIVDLMELPTNGKLWEFSFAVVQIAKDAIAIKQARAAVPQPPPVLDA